MIVRFGRSPRRDRPSEIVSHSGCGVTELSTMRALPDRRRVRFGPPVLVAAPAEAGPLPRYEIGMTSSGRSHITAGGFALTVPIRFAPTLR